MVEKLSLDEQLYLLRLARQAIKDALDGNPITPLQLDTLSPRLKEMSASFVTLTHQGELRGCIGALEPYQPLAEDVREHAVAAAIQDYRFPPLQPKELPIISIEISVLTPPQYLDYDNPEDLLEKLTPGIDGVILRDGSHRATFLPQVWEKIPDKAMFLSQLCMKMGAAPSSWRSKKIKVQTYHVEEFHE
jgi:AmmeMemoRadiSam system protein A